jgi:hypothetical protein
MVKASSCRLETSSSKIQGPLPRQPEFYTVVTMSVSDAIQLASLIILAFSGALAWSSLRKYRNSRGIDFILEAESAIDPLYHKMVGAEPALIRNAYRSYGIAKLSDENCRVFPFMHVVYSQVSRMYFILSAKQLDYGLDQSMRAEMIKGWVSELEQYKHHPAMIAMHRHAIQAENFNSAFLRLASEIFSHAGESRGNGSESPPGLH